MGLKNLYQMISASNLKYFKRVPTIPKSLLREHREGIIVGSACEAGELFRAVADHKDWEELKRIASFYDYLEIQPLCNNAFMLRNGDVQSEEDLREFNRTIVRLGEELGKPVCATGDVHFLEPEDEVYRHILLASKKFPDANAPLPIYFKTTDEMLKEFSYLGKEKAYEVVVTNTRLVADQVENFELLPAELFPPRLANSEEELNRLVWEKVHRLYGDDPPQADRGPPECGAGRHSGQVRRGVHVRPEAGAAELGKRLPGGLPWLRGLVSGGLHVRHHGGQLPAAPLPLPQVQEHRVHPWTAPTAAARTCRTRCAPCAARKYIKDGFDIPFETFLGFGGGKVPDIDLNFSGEYQARAHRHAIEMFGETQVFRAGTIGTLAEKTAYGFVKKYLEENGITAGRAEENRLTLGCVGTRRTTGQHPGGLVVVPDDHGHGGLLPGAASGGRRRLRHHHHPF